MWTTWASTIGRHTRSTGNLTFQHQAGEQLFEVRYYAKSAKKVTLRRMNVNQIHPDNLQTCRNERIRRPNATPAEAVHPIRRDGPDPDEQSKLLQIGLSGDFVQDRSGDSTRESATSSSTRSPGGTTTRHSSERTLRLSAITTGSRTSTTSPRSGRSPATTLPTGWCSARCTNCRSGEASSST